MTVDVLKLIVEVTVLLVAIGRWAGRRDRPTSSLFAPPPALSAATAQDANGKPTLGELTRRVEELERERSRYVLQVEALARFESNQREHEELRTQIRGTQRRLERIEGMTTET